MVLRSEAEAVFRAMLGRPLESGAASYFERLSSATEIVLTISNSPEFQKRTIKSPFEFYNSCIDTDEIVRRHEDKERNARDGFKVNYFGVAIPNAVIPSQAFDLVPPVEADPLPANWHADAAEFAAALRAVDLAQHSFTMIELGCGWGCWMNITGRCAKRRGLKLNLIGVEGDGKNLGLAKDTLKANGFKSEEYRLWHGIAHASSGHAAFPQQGADGEAWDLEPVLSTDSEKYDTAVASGKYAVLPMIGIGDMTAGLNRIDLLHIDIQGGEGSLVAECSDIFAEKVAYALIGTHSREIEGALFAHFRKAGWCLEIERPAILELRAHGKDPCVKVDGVQGWRNPHLF